MTCAHGHACAHAGLHTRLLIHASTAGALSQRTPAHHLHTNAVPRCSQPAEAQRKGPLTGQTWQVNLLPVSLPAWRGGALGPQRGRTGLRPPGSQLPRQKGAQVS